MLALALAFLLSGRVRPVKPAQVYAIVLFSYDKDNREDVAFAAQPFTYKLYVDGRESVDTEFNSNACCTASGTKRLIAIPIEQYEGHIVWVDAQGANMQDRFTLTKQELVKLHLIVY